MNIPKTITVFIFLTSFLSSASFAQINDPKYKDYFLMGQFGEVCTMCEVMVLCETSSEIPVYSSIPEAGTYTLYHIQTGTFWSQIATIWEWFVSNFSTSDLAVRGHTRPVYVYSVEDGNWSTKQIIEGRLILEPGLLEFGDHNIDRVSSTWINASSGESIGFCQRMPLWDSLEQIKANAPGGEL